MTDADQLDRALVEAGEHWRSAQQPAPALEAVWRRPERVGARQGGMLLVAAASVVALAAMALGAGGSARPSPAAPVSHVAVAWDDVQIRAAEVHPGDIVTATGDVILRPGEPAQLCSSAFDLLMGDPPTCSPIAVGLSGSPDLSGIPDRKTVNDTTFASVRVVGRWTGTAIEQPAVTKPSAAPHGDEAPLPCPTPDGGWASPSTSGAFRRALDPLAAEIGAHPELYAGYYTQPISGTDETVPAVEIVRTKVDPRTLVAGIEGLFPYAVCLTRDYAPAELDAAKFAFANGPVSQPSISGDTHRVGVEIAAVDDRTMPLFLGNPAAYPIPLVTRYLAPRSTEAVPTPTTSPTYTSVDTPRASPKRGFELPSVLIGLPVLVGDDALRAFAGSTDATPMLVGGWLDESARSCPAALLPRDPFYVCDGIFLRSRPSDGPSTMVLYKGSGGRIALPDLPQGSTVPVVVRVHTHDSACLALRTDCVLLPVADAVVWSGDVGPIPSPTSTEPPNGIREATARAIAIGVARGPAPRPGPDTPSEVAVISARSGHFAEVGPAGSTDVDGERWVWAVVVRGFIVARDCVASIPCRDTGMTSLIVLDYVTGEVLIQETPAP